MPMASSKSFTPGVGATLPLERGIASAGALDGTGTGADGAVDGTDGVVDGANGAPKKSAADAAGG